MPSHRYGWVKGLPDQRDLLYAAPSRLSQNLPPCINLSDPALPAPFEPCFNQGDVGSCGPHCAMENLIFDMLQSGMPTCPIPSPLFIYYTTRAIMGTLKVDSGVDNRSMLKALARFGWCDLELMPYTGKVKDIQEEPSPAAIEQAKERKITEYRSVPQTLVQMKSCLADKHPFIAGFTVYESLESDEVEKTGIVPMSLLSERAMGGHDVLIVGYDDATQSFLFKNSWGKAWGKNGYGTLPYVYLTSANLSGDFWTVTDAGLKNFPKLPPVLASIPRTITVYNADRIEIDGQRI